MMKGGGGPIAGAQMFSRFEDKMKKSKIMLTLTI